MEFTFVQIISFGFAIFRLTHLVVYDKITEFLRSPFFDEVVEKENGVEEVYLIPKKGGFKGFAGELISCYWCTGIWVSMFLYGGYLWFPSIFGPCITILAVAGVAAVIEAAVQNWNGKG